MRGQGEGTKKQHSKNAGNVKLWIHWNALSLGGGTVEKRSTQQSIATFTTFWQAWATQEPSSKKLKSFCQQECQTARLLDYVVAPNKVYLPGQISMVPVSLLRKCWHHLYKESLARIPVSNWGTGTGQSPGLLGTIPRPGLAVKLTLTPPTPGPYPGSEGEQIPHNRTFLLVWLSFSKCKCIIKESSMKDTWPLPSLAGNKPLCCETANRPFMHDTKTPSTPNLAYKRLQIYRTWLTRQAKKKDKRRNSIQFCWKDGLLL